MTRREGPGGCPLAVLVVLTCMLSGSLTTLELWLTASDMQWRIHHVAYVVKRMPRSGSNFSAALTTPSEPSLIRSSSVSLSTHARHALPRQPLLLASHVSLPPMVHAEVGGWCRGGLAG